MKQTGPYARRPILGLVLGAALSGKQALAQEPAAKSVGVRYEISIGTHTWPGLEDIRPITGGSFDTAGFNLGGAVHWPVGRWSGGELLLGMDLAIHNNESDIRLFSEDLSVRDLYIGPSIKWVHGDLHRYSLDFGLNYHDIDIAELAGTYPYFSETVIWDDGGIGAYLGASLDFNAGTPGRRHGLSLAVKVHFVSFDVSGDEPLLVQRFGTERQTVSAPIYALQLGYRWR